MALQPVYLRFSSVGFFFGPKSDGRVTLRKACLPIAEMHLKAKPRKTIVPGGRADSVQYSTEFAPCQGAYTGVVKINK